jgi:hypothetical protein
MSGVRYSGDGSMVIGTGTIGGTHVVTPDTLRTFVSTYARRAERWPLERRKLARLARSYTGGLPVSGEALTTVLRTLREESTGRSAWERQVDPLIAWVFDLDEPAVMFSGEEDAAEERDALASEIRHIRNLIGRRKAERITLWLNGEPWRMPGRGLGR